MRDALSSRPDCKERAVDPVGEHAGQRCAALGCHRITQQLLARGDRVAATLRRPGALDDLKAQYGDALWIGFADATDTTGLRATVDAAFAAMGRSVDGATPMAVYGGTPVKMVRKMSASYPVKGTPAKMAGAIIACVDSGEAPLRLLFGSDAWPRVTATVQTRLKAWQAQKNVALSTDIDG